VVRAHLIEIKMESVGCVGVSGMASISMTGFGMTSGDRMIVPGMAVNADIRRDRGSWFNRHRFHGGSGLNSADTSANTSANNRKEKVGCVSHGPDPQQAESG